ncbi:MAG: hypothetical protein Q8P89_00930 [bacterium]|nr:hypothetical protein [bacterium]
MPKGALFPYKLYLLPVLIGAAVIFIFVKFTIPQFQQILTVREELKVKQARLDQLVAKSRSLEAQSKETLMDKLQTTQKALPSEKDVAGLLYTWARLQNEAGVASEGIEFSPGIVSTPSSSPKASGPLPPPGSEASRDEASSPATPSSSAKPSGSDDEQATPKAAKKGPASFNFNIGVKGDFSAIRSLLDKIKEINPLIVISDLNFSFRDGAVRADLKVRYYYQLLAPFSGKVDDPLPALSPKDEEILSEIARFPAYNELPQEAKGETSGKLDPFR